MTTTLSTLLQSGDLDILRQYLDEHPAEARAQLVAGVDLPHADFDARRLLLGLTEDRDSSSLNLSAEEFIAGMTPRYGERNPHERTRPYFVRMIQTGLTAYAAREQFKQVFNQLPEVDPPNMPYPGWSAARFGQSMTFLPDGRVIQVGGEHEDYYDSDFCIYNDVFVHHPDGQIQVFGYPADVFPPTDFHTATLVGDHIYVIGCLGYDDAPLLERTPVYRLDTTTYAIEAVLTNGDDPGRLYQHSAQLLQGNDNDNSSVIRISGGTCDDRVYHFDVATHRWSLVVGHKETDPHKRKLDQVEMRDLVRRAEKQVEDYWEGREPGGENEANDPQHHLAPEFFELYLAQHRLGGAYNRALTTAFSMWSNLDGGSAQIDAHIPKIIPEDHAMRWVRNIAHNAYLRDGRADEFEACFDRMLALVSSDEGRAYLLFDRIREWMYSADDPTVKTNVRTSVEQLLQLQPSGYLADEARRYLQQLDILDELGIGKPAPKFTRTDIDGNVIDLAALRGRVVLLDFWATWCGPCIGEMPHLKRVASAFADKPFTLISISLDEDMEAAKRMIAVKQMTWTHVLEGGWGDNELPALYGVMGIPQLFLIDPAGHIHARGLRGHEVDKAVGALIAQME